MRWLLTIVLAGTAWAQGGPPEGLRGPRDPGEDAPRPLFEQFRTMMRAVRDLGPWEQQHAYIQSALTEIYQRNDWTSESDQFSFQLIDAVQSVPPWDFQGRMDTLFGMVSDRYLLDEEQERMLRERSFEALRDVFMAHAADALPVFTQFVQVRASGAGFTPEQVARWTQALAPMSDTARRRFMGVMNEMLPTLDPTQQELLRSDMAAAERRLERVNEMRQRWAQGQWSPSDWGLDRDPIQQRAAMQQPAGAAAAPEGGAAQPPGPARGERAAGKAEAGAPEPAPEGAVEPGRPGAATAADPDPWARHVREFIAKYGLDDAQQQSAWAAYRSVAERRDLLRKRQQHQEEAAAQRGGDGAARASLGKRYDAAVERLFGQLKKRLESLPTRAQRRAAESAGAAS